MQAMAQIDRASFVYGSNDQMTTEVKSALSAFDLDKTGRVSTSELVAGAKALQEVRGQNSFMRKIMLIHAVTMGLLLAGMFGLSMAAMELSKETKVGTEGALVTQKGEAVLVGSSEMYIVPAADGSPELRQRPSSDGRQLSDGGSAVVVATKPTAVLDLSGDGNRRLEDGKWSVLNRLNYDSAFAFMSALKQSSDRNYFYILLPGDDGEMVELEAKVNRKMVNGKGVKLQALLLGTRVTVRCRRDMQQGRCFVYMEKNDGFDLVSQSTLCMKKGVCPKDAWEHLQVDEAHLGPYVSDSDIGQSWASWSEMGLTGR